MNGRPVFQNTSDLHMWKRIRGEGVQGILSSAKGGLDGAVDSILASDGNIHPAVLVAAIEELEKAGTASPERLAKIVQRSRSIDCTPSVAAADVMLSRDDATSAAELLSISARSQEVLNRSLAAARIYEAEGDLYNARESATRAYGSDPDDPRVYELMMRLDPEGGWAERQNIQLILSGERPENRNGNGEMQELFSIYYEWFRGDREKATSELISSRGYTSKDPEFMLASARMSVDERDWHSACMMYDSIVDSSPDFVRREAASAHISMGDSAGALALLSKADTTSPKTMKLIVLARRLSGDRREMMDSARVLLENEFSGLDDHLDIVRSLISDRMLDEAGSLLEQLLTVYPHDPEVLAAESELRMTRGDMTGALTLAISAVRHGPKCISARIQKARVLLANDKPDMASKECDIVIRKDPENKDVIALMRDIRFSEDDYPAAADLCSKLLDIDPADTDARISLAECRCRSGEPDQASDLLARALRDDPGRDNSLRVVRTMLANGMWRDALSTTRDLAKRFPDDATFMRLKGNAEYGSGEYMAASVSYASAAGLEPHDPDIWHSKGMADEARGDLESAESAYDRAIILDMGKPSYWISRSSVQIRRGDLHGAVESLNRVIELDPRSVYALVQKAKIVASASRYDEAMHLLDLAEVIHDDRRDIIRVRMRIQTDSGRIDEAISSGKEILGLGGDSEDVLALCSCLMRHGDYSEAFSTADSGLKDDPENPALVRMKDSATSALGCSIDPTTEETPVVEDAPAVKDDDRRPEEDPDSLAEIASSLLSAGDVKGAIRTIDRSIAMDPEDPGYQCIKARAVLASGDRDGASMLAVTALRVNPNDPSLHEVLGDIRSSGGDTGGALQEYEAAIVLGMDSSRVFVKRGDCQASQGEVSKAVESYTLAIVRDQDNMDLTEKLVDMMISQGDAQSAERYVMDNIARHPDSARPIVLLAEYQNAIGDEEGVLKTYEDFQNRYDPGSECTRRMVKVLEKSGHTDVARSLSTSDSDHSDDKSIKRYAEKAMRRAVATKTSIDDPDILLSLGLDHSMSTKVSSYLSNIGDYGRIEPGTDEFRRMELQSHDIIIKLNWRDLDGKPLLPLERVFITGGYRDADDAKKLVAYVRKAMACDVGRKADPRITSMSMRLPKGMTVFEVMRECNVGVYEARQILSQII